MVFYVELQPPALYCNPLFVKIINLCATRIQIKALCKFLDVLFTIFVHERLSMLSFWRHNGFCLLVPELIIVDAK